MRAIRDSDNEKARHAYENWGFMNLSPRSSSKYSINGRAFVYEPSVAGPGAPHPGARRLRSYGRSVAEKVHAGLRQTGSVRPPREFVLMDRSALGLGSVFLRLKAEQNWYRMFHELIEGFSTAAVAARQTAALVEAGVPQAFNEIAARGRFCCARCRFQAAQASATASATALGVRSITIRRTRAAGSGRLSPCSHSRTAATARPNRAANAGRLKPSFARIARTSGTSGARCTRAGSISCRRIAAASWRDAISSSVMSVRVPVMIASILFAFAPAST